MGVIILNITFKDFSLLTLKATDLENLWKNTMLFECQLDVVTSDKFNILKGISGNNTQFQNGSFVSKETFASVIINIVSVGK